MFHHDSTRNAEVATADAAEFFRKRHADKLATRGDEAGQTARALITRAGEIRDYVINLDGGRFRWEDGANGGSVRMVPNGSDRTVALHKQAVRQAGERLGVPAAYIRELADSGTTWKKKLAANILAEHSANGPRQRVLVRTLPSADGNGAEARAILSENYRRLNSSSILLQFVQGVKDAGATLYRAEATDTRFFVEAALPDVFTLDGKNGVEYVSCGVTYSTSDFGDGADEVRGWIERIWCTNKAVAAQSLRTVHLGRKLEAGEIEFSQKTYELDTQTQASMVSDVVSGVLAADNVRRLLTGAAQAAQVVIPDASAAFAALGKSGLSKAELAQLDEIFRANDPAVIPAGPLTAWKLSQGVSAVANEAATKRRNELAALAGTMIFSAAGAAD